jgi:hypothetical protein
LVEIAINSFKENNADSMRLIAYRNSSIEKINSVMRTQLYCEGDEEKEKNLPQFMPNELIISNGGYNVVAINSDNSRAKPVNVIYNNQTFRVISTMPVKQGPRGINSLLMNLSPKPALPDNTAIYSLDWENGRHKYFEMSNELKRRAQDNGKLWIHYYNLKEQFAWFDYAYALNSHKSQGRTFLDAIVFENDIFSVKKTNLKNKLQSLYVACTRASRRVYIYNSKYRVDQSELPEFIRKELNI